MPLITWAVLTYALTLIVVLSGNDTRCLVVIAGALCTCALAAARAQKHVALIAAVAACAGLVALGTHRTDAQCRAWASKSTQWAILFEQDLATPGISRGRLEAPCDLRATLLVRGGRVRAGQVALVHGTGSVSESGIFVENAFLGEVVRTPLAPKLRARAAARINRIYGADAPMARALVIGDMSGIPPDERDRYAQSGLVHMLSVSGLHVGIIALALELLAVVMRLPAQPARVATMIVLGAYVAAIGAPPPAVRAAVMLGAMLLSRLVQRPTSKWAILALGAGAPLLEPRVALDLGWQLSVAGTASLISGGALARRIVSPGLHAAARNVASAATISIVATIATAPLVAWTFGRVALLGPVTNILADPIMGLLQPVLFIGVAIPVGVVEHISADAAHGLLAAFSAIAAVASEIPFAAPAVMPTSFAAIASAIACIAFLVACCARHPERAALLAAVSCAAMVMEPVLPSPARDPELHMLDVGQGDAFAIRTSHGRWIVVDAGRSWKGSDAGKTVVAPYLARLGGDVALFVLSHPHADHVGGAASLFALRHPARFLDPGYVGTSPPYRSALERASRDGIPWSRVRPGETITVDDVQLTALAPDSAWAASLNDANLASTVMLAHVGSARVLFTGDAEGPEEEWLLAHYADSLRADVLKVGHHGSRTSTTEAFLHAVAPRIALVSVGAHNAYGHPDAEVMDALDDAGAVTVRTDQLGTVVLSFRRRTIEVTARSLHWRVPLADTH